MMDQTTNTPDDIRESASVADDVHGRELLLCLHMKSHLGTLRLGKGV
jgi:hypothetical protein